MFLTRFALRLGSRLLVVCIGAGVFVALLTPLLSDWPQVIFISQQPHGLEIFTVEVDRGIAMNLLRGLVSQPASARSASWSPNGQKLAFVSDFDGGLKIFLLDMQTNTLAPLFTHGELVYPHWSPAWSPDGRFIAFVSYEARVGDTTLFIAELLENRPKPLLTLAKLPVASLAWHENRVALTAPVFGQPGYALLVGTRDAPGRSRQITANVDVISMLSWSPDGRYILFDSSRSDNYYDVYVVDVETGEERNLTQHRSADFGGVWSKKSDKIAFVSNRDGDFEVYLMDADGSNVQQLTYNNYSDFNPVWSPDDQRIAFASFPHTDGEIYVMNADGSGLRRLTYHSGDDLVPIWRPYASR